MGKEIAHDGVTVLDPDQVAIPCGLIAKSVFNDTYLLNRYEDFRDAGKVTIDDSDIAWKSDVDFKFKNQPGEWEKEQWTDISDRKFLTKYNSYK